MDVSEKLERIKETIIEGNDNAAAEVSRQALDEGMDALVILNDGLMEGADIVGKKFENGEFFLPQLMMAGRALKAAMSVIEPELEAAYARGDGVQGDTGVVVIATVQTDIHDIGKNIVSSMLTASGFKVDDMGVDVPIKSMIARAQEINADIIACSALLTTSMPFMRDLVNLLEAMGERERFKVMVGGASVSDEYAAMIGADGTAPNAVQAVKLAQTLIRDQRAATGV